MQKRIPYRRVTAKPSYKVKTLSFSLIFIVVSFVIVAWGQPAAIPVFGILSALAGYALFWKGISKYRFPFLWGFLWFAAVSAVQLSWMATAVYHGTYIYGVYAFLLVLVALEFGIFTLLVVRRPLTYFRIVFLCAVWVLFEWTRLFWLSGFSWNPVGLAWGCSTVTLQVASLWGVYGLSFLCMFCNLCLLGKKKLSFCLAALFPFAYGGAQLYYNASEASKTQEYNHVLLLQTAISPGEKMGYPTDPAPMIHPLEQWYRIMDALKPYYGKRCDFIVLPEGALPYGSHSPIYAREQANALLVYCLGSSALKYVPREDTAGVVSNGYIAQTIANAFNTQLIIGFEEPDLKTNRVYNAALLFSPKSPPKMYEKRVLVPMGEYIPFEWAKTLARNYGIEDSFTPGSEAKVFAGASITICYEETYGHLVREGRLMGAQLLVNITNDNWFPGSTLALQHSEHARLRSVENGAPLIRAANTGITIAIDSSGRTIARLGTGREGEWDPGALYVLVPKYTYWTPYLFWGDMFIITLALLIFLSTFILFCCRIVL